MLGKRIRLERVMDRNTRKIVMVPLIHGVGMGPIEGIKDIRNTVDTVALGGANAVILHKGIVASAHRGTGKDIGLVLHLTATTEDGKQALVAGVEEALIMGADAVSIRIELGGPEEETNLKTLGEVAGAASRWGMPLFTLIHPKQEGDEKTQLKNLMRAARVGAEIGADVVRVPYSGSVHTFKEVVSVCPVPLVAIGKEKKGTEKEVLEMVQGAMEAGACGVSVGRSVFQHKKPGNMIKAISEIVHKGFSVSTAVKALCEQPIEGTIFGKSVIW